MALRHVGHNCNPWEGCDVCGAKVEPPYRQRTDVCAMCGAGFTVCQCRHQLREWRESMIDPTEQVIRSLRAENERLRAACTLALNIMEQTNKVNVPPLARFIEVTFAPEDVAAIRAALEKP